MTPTKQREPMNDSDRLDEILVERLSHQFDMSHKTVRALLKAAAYPDLAALADRYRKDAERLLAALTEALDHCVSNAGYRFEAYRCHTYPVGVMPGWVTKARAAIDAARSKT